MKKDILQFLPHTIHRNLFRFIELTANPKIIQHIGDKKEYIYKTLR